MTTAWRKDGEVLYDAEVQNYARYQEGELSYTTVLHLPNVNFTDEGRYQCVVSNHFGANYSNRAKLTVNGEYVSGGSAIMCMHKFYCLFSEIVSRLGGQCNNFQMFKTA